MQPMATFFPRTWRGLGGPEGLAGGTFSFSRVRPKFFNVFNIGRVTICTVLISKTINMHKNTHKKYFHIPL